MTNELKISRELAETLATTDINLEYRKYRLAVEELRALLSTSLCSEVDPQCSEQLRTHAAPVVERQYKDIDCENCPACAALVPPNSDCKYCGPVVERQEPQVMGRVYTDDGVTACHLNSIGRALPDGTPLFAGQHAPVAVVLPEQIELLKRLWHVVPNGYKSEISSCLDKVKELNQ